MYFLLDTDNKPVYMNKRINDNNIIIYMLLFIQNFSSLRVPPPSPSNRLITMTSQVEERGERGRVQYILSPSLLYTTVYAIAE